MENEKQTVEFTKEQFLALMKAVNLGNWMANAQRTGSPEDPHIEDYENISDYIFSLAPKFGFAKYMDHEKSDGKRYFPTNEFEEKTDINKLHEDYDEECFWDELSDRLGEREFFRKYSKEEREKMDQEEHFLKLQECIIAWEEELENYGIERIEMLKQAKDFGINI